MSDNIRMTSGEFIRAIKKLAQKQGWSCYLIHSRGKGSHATLYLEEKRTIVKDRTKEIGPGLLAKMLNDLGLTKNDIQKGR